MAVVIKIVLVIGLCFKSLFLLSQEDNKGYYVDLRGKKQYIHVQGEGKPTLVFLSGKARPETDFKKIYHKLKTTNKIVSYDRSGIGKSEEIKNTRTVDTMAYELHELLIKENITPPYILIGHSMGGYIMRCFANMYPNTIAGMVFIEPAHEYEYKYGLEIRNDSDKTVFKTEFRNYLKIKNKYKAYKTESKQAFNFDSLGFSCNQKIVKDLPIPKAIPITIIISKQADVENAYINKEIDYKIEFFEKWKSINPDVKIITTLKSGYFIQKEEPNLVIDAIKELILKTKK